MQEQRAHLPKALVVHDDRNLNLLVSILLPGSGYLVTAFDNGHDALKCMSENHFDIVFADLQIPGAWTLACHVKRVFPEIPVVIITAQRREDTVALTRQADMDAVLFKPFGPDEFWRTLKKHHAKPMEFRMAS